MCRATRSLAVLLSLLLVSAPVAAWACDLSCSSHRAHPDCHSSATAGKEDSAMTMPPRMDMGSDDGESSMVPDTVTNAMPGHSMFLSPQQEMAIQGIEQATKPEMSTGAMQDHSKSVSSCTHETCSQDSVSASPPRPDHSQLDSLHWIAISISSPVNLWVSFHWIRPGTSPPKLLADGRLIPTLRI
jgi:hypothetical protein